KGGSKLPEINDDNRCNRGNSALHSRSGSVERKSGKKLSGSSLSKGHVVSSTSNLEAILMEDKTEVAIGAEREGKAAEVEGFGRKPRRVPAFLPLQKEHGGSDFPGASTVVGLDGLDLNCPSPKSDSRRPHKSCPPGPRKPKRDGANRNRPKTPKKCRKAQSSQIPRPDDVAG
ncbi:hypothetical protein Ancab_021189, partial [Ancistrocladus abbreviatus]